MAKPMTPIDHAKQALRHHTTLNTFASVVALLEASTVYDSRSHATQAKIIKLCLAEQQRQLTRMDAALAKVARGVPSVVEAADTPSSPSAKAGSAE